VVLLGGSNWETGEGGSPGSAAATLAVGWAMAAWAILSHFDLVPGLSW